MKKALFILSFCLIGSIAMQAQTTTASKDFLGTWNMVFIGVPDGDVKCQLVLTDSLGKLSGIIKFADPKPGEAPIANPEVKDSVITFNATLQGYDVDFYLTRKMDNTLNGTMYNNMFEVNGKKNEEASPAKK